MDAIVLTLQDEVVVLRFVEGLLGLLEHVVYLLVHGIQIVEFSSLLHQFVVLDALLVAQPFVLVEDAEVLVGDVARGYLGWSLALSGVGGGVGPLLRQGQFLGSFAGGAARAAGVGLLLETLHEVGRALNFGLHLFGQVPVFLLEGLESPLGYFGLSVEFH